MTKGNGKKLQKRSLKLSELIGKDAKVYSGNELVYEGPIVRRNKPLNHFGTIYPSGYYMGVDKQIPLKKIEKIDIENKIINLENL